MTVMEPYKPHTNVSGIWGSVFCRSSKSASVLDYSHDVLHSRSLGSQWRKVDSIAMKDFLGWHVVRLKLRVTQEKNPMLRSRLVQSNRTPRESRDLRRKKIAIANVLMWKTTSFSPPKNWRTPSPPWIVLCIYDDSWILCAPFLCCHDWFRPRPQQGPGLQLFFSLHSFLFGGHFIPRMSSRPRRSCNTCYRKVPLNIQRLRPDWPDHWIEDQKFTPGHSTLSN